VPAKKMSKPILTGGGYYPVRINNIKSTSVATYSWQHRRAA
jgi:hypothetical protein